jgi:hypothetical protein
VPDVRSVTNNVVAISLYLGEHVPQRNFLITAEINKQTSRKRYSSEDGPTERTLGSGEAAEEVALTLMRGHSAHNLLHDAHHGPTWQRTKRIGQQLG